MPTKVNDILGIMLGLVTLLILIKHLLPSLSSLFKEKIMGITPSESFDLEELVQKKVNLYQIEQGHSQDLFEKNLQLNHKTQALQFIHNLNWDSKSCLSELNKEARKLELAEIPSMANIKRTYEQLKSIKSFSDGPALEFDNLKRFILFYATFFPEMETTQKEAFYHKSHLKLIKPDLKMNSVIEAYRAEFSVQA